MRFLTIAVYSMNGISDKGKGNPYSMKQLVALNPFEGFTTLNKETGEVITNRQGVGFSTIELPVADSFYPKLQSFFANEYSLKPQPIMIDFETNVRLRGRQTETIITDFSDAFKAKYPALKEAS